MRWIPFAASALLLWCFQAGLHNLLALPGPEGVAPSLLLVLGVFVGLHAPPVTVLWGCLLLGLLVDLLPQSPPVLGPAMLGFVAGGYLLVQVRGMVFRDSLPAVAVLTAVTAVFVHVVLNAVLCLRGLNFIGGSGVTWQALPQLWRGLGAALYTGAAAVPLGWLLLRLKPLWGFPEAGGRSLR